MLRQATKKRWNELSLKLKSPFEQLAHQRQEKQRLAKTTKGRSRAVSLKNNKLDVNVLESLVHLTRANQKLAKEALQITQNLVNELQESLDQN